MRRRWRTAGPGLALLSGLGALGLAAPAWAEPGSPPTSIIGGTSVADGQYPTVVGLTIGQSLCTGTLIAPSWVLTAAHCVDPEVLGLRSQAEVTRSTKVHFDTVDILHDPGIVIEASATFKDPLFDQNRLGSNDIGLVQLAAPILDIAPSPINLNAALAPVGTVATIVGYGTTEQSAGGTVGAKFELRNRISTSCASFQVGNDANLLCFSQTDDRGTCQGDSGGPAFAGINGRQVVVGVTSFGDRDCAEYGADTRVDVEQSFLVMHVPELIGCRGDQDCPGGRTCFAHSCIAEPFGPSGIGTACTTAADCDPSVCAEGLDGKRCSLTCNLSDDSSCPDGFECLRASSGALGACWPQAGGGCCEVGGAGGPGTAVLGMGAIAIGLRRRRGRQGG